MRKGRDLSKLWARSYSSGGILHYKAWYLGIATSMVYDIKRVPHGASKWQYRLYVNGKAVADGCDSRLRYIKQVAQEIEDGIRTRPGN